MARLQTESEAPNTAALIPGMEDLLYEVESVRLCESELREALRHLLEELERRSIRTRSLRIIDAPSTKNRRGERDPECTRRRRETSGTSGAYRGRHRVWELPADAAVTTETEVVRQAPGEQGLGRRLADEAGHRDGAEAMRPTRMWRSSRTRSKRLLANLLIRAVGRGARDFLTNSELRRASQHFIADRSSNRLTASPRGPPRWGADPP